MQSGVPLTPEQKILPPGALLPSGEMNFFDMSQDRSYHEGSGINNDFPHPSGYDTSKALIATFPPTSGYPVTSGEVEVGSGNIFNRNGPSGLFSNPLASTASGITDFTIFNPYIHYYTAPTTNIFGSGNGVVSIPYTSDYTVSSPFDVYSNDNYAYYTYNQLFGT